MQTVSASLPPTNYADDHAKRITSAEVVGTLGEDMFGEQVNFYTGSTSFTHTDLEVPGNSALPVRAGRRFAIDGSKVDPYGHAFGDWELDVPYLSGTYPADRGWQVSTSAPNNRCSSPATPEQAAPPTHSWWHGYEIWQGNSLYVPGAGDQTVLFREATIPGAPSFSWITKSFWLLTCTPSILNGSGEGFIATAPDGTRYTFDRLATRRARGLGKSDGEQQYLLERHEVRLYVSQVQDRFGNWVRYNWGGSTPATTRLNSITSSDQRMLTFGYASGTSTRITSVTDGVRTVAYAYQSDSLRTVTYPDASRWTLDLANANPGGPEAGSSFGDWDLDTPHCAPRRFLKTNLGSAQLTHPSGAVGSFTFRYRRHHRSGVPDSFCYHGATMPPNGVSLSPPPPEQGFPWEFTSSVPITFDVLAMDSKTITGAGASVAHWSYAYDDSTLADRRIVSVSKPDSSTQNHIFGRRYNVNEGQLLLLEVWSPTSELLRRTQYAYAQSAQGYPNRPGVSPNFSLDVFQAELLRPQTLEWTQQDGVDFYRETLEHNFNAFAQPEKIRRYSRRSDNSLRGDKTEDITYAHDTANWVINLPATVSVGGSTVSQTTYFPSFHPAKALPQHHYSFGQRVATYAYTADGLLSSVADGRNYYTHLSDYYRGVPRRIAMPDGGIWQAHVSPIGRITLSTDPFNNTSYYGYDGMGRLNRITYPADSPAWAPKTFSFAPTGPAQFGLPAGHWQHTTTHGNYRKVVHFDAYWRPVVTREWDAANPAETTRTVVRRFDALGREAFISHAQPALTLSWNDPSIKGTHRQYDALGRLRLSEQDTELGRLPTQIDYLPGFIKQITDARFGVTKWSFQTLDQPDESFPVDIQQPEGVITTIERDVYGKQLLITRSGTYANSPATAARHFVYDAQQRLCKQIDPESGASVFGYDSANNLIWSAEGRALPSLSCDGHTVPASQRTTRSYDPMNRLVAENYPDGSPGIFYEYAQDGLPVRTSTSQGVEWRYGYNKRRQPTFEEYESGEIMRFTFGYDTLGNQSSVTYPGAVRVDYYPNALGQPAQAGSYATAVKYFPNGQVKQFSYGNGITRVNTQNQAGMLARVQDSYAGTAVHDFEYLYDANRNLQQLIDRSSGQGGMQSRTMSYDLLDRLTAASGGGLPNARYAYDPLDNLREADLGTRRYDYVYDPASWRLSSIRQRGGATMWNFGYDTRGASVAKGSQGYAFDAAQRLLEVPGKAQYYYDAEGRRIGQSRNEGPAKYSLYTRDGLQRGGPDNGLSGNNWQVYLGRQLVASVFEYWGSSSRQVTYHHTDLLGSPVVDTDSARKVLRRTYYTPYGEAQNRTVDGPGYTSHVADGNTGLVYMQQRYYDPVVGRFLSRDPVGVDAGTGGNFNRYWYANNNPYKFVDPDGRAAACAIPGIMQVCMAAVVKAVNVVGFLGTATYAAFKGSQYLNESAASGSEGEVEPEFTDSEDNKLPWRGEPGSTVRGGTQSTTYGNDGYAETQRDTPHPDEKGCGNGDHCHDIGRPENGGPPTHRDRGPSRPPRPGDPPKPRGPNTPIPEEKI